MKRDYKLFIRDMIESINIIQEYLKNITQEQFMRDIKKSPKIRYLRSNQKSIFANFCFAPAISNFQIDDAAKLRGLNPI